MKKPKTGTSVELTDLTGLHVLSGVDYESSGDNPANAILFVLDGVTYRATENPSDGYRSCLREIQVVDAAVKNQFPKCRVLGCHLQIYRSHRSDVVEFRDVVNGKPILAVGTEDIDDYYPSYVAEFMPENMAVNAGKAGGV